MTVTAFTLIWLLVSVVGIAVYIWDRHEAKRDGDFLNLPPPGMTERRARPQSHMIVQGDVRAATLYLVGQVSAFGLGVASLWTPSNAPSRGLTTRGFVLILGFIILEAMTSAGGVVRIYVRRWLRRRHAAEIESVQTSSDMQHVEVIAEQLDKEMPQ